MICRYMPQKERLLLWKSTGNTVPDGYVLSHSCDVPYCGNLQHMCVRRDKTTGWSRTAHYAKLVREMKPGEFFDLPRPKNMSNFRTAIYAGAKEVKVSIRVLRGTNMIRVMRTGSWDDPQAAAVIAKDFPLGR